MKKRKEVITLYKIISSITSKYIGSYKKKIQNSYISVHSRITCTFNEKIKIHSK